VLPSHRFPSQVPTRTLSLSLTRPLYLTRTLTLTLAPPPTQLYERIVPDYVAKAPLGLSKFGQPKSQVSALTTIPTAITGGIRKDVPLSFGLVARLALAGGLCSG